MGHHRELRHHCVSRSSLGAPTVASVAGLEQTSAISYVPPPDKQIGHLLLDRESFQVRLARPDTAQESDALVHRMYTHRGYLLHTPDQVYAANEITLQACHGENVFGTLTVRFDSGGGLGADALYRDTIDEYRNSGGCVAELTRLAVDPEFGSKEVLGALFHLAYVFCGPVRHVDDVFIEVNPRHVPFYRRMLHFRTAGECKICPRVAAPAVLMHVKVEYVGVQAARCGGQHSETARSLYPYFCSALETEHLTRRILAVSSVADWPSVPSEELVHGPAAVAT